ncbi:phosphotransferase family protein [Ornithinibacillus contaminans]|uniref:phosphotransferase family protein n=1 Tax=Ornithinibacillus contaminans TaxID=694055 RepID=UPI00064DD36D|nr:phosphotransferase [Ornithinibacillus contaminans]
MPSIHKEEIPKELLDYIGPVQQITYPSQGCTSRVAILESKHASYIVKHATGEQFANWLKKEAMILTILMKTSIAAPEIFKLVYSEENQDCWVLMEYIEGMTLRKALTASTNEAERLDLLYQFGKILRKLHNTPCPDELITEQSWLNVMLEDAENNLRHYNVDGSEELLHELQRKRPKEQKQTLIHGDFTIDNVMVHNGKVTTIIDWSGGAFGDPRYDVSLAIRPKPNAFEKDTDKAVFFKGYGEQLVSDEEYWYFAEGLYEFF